MAKSTTSASNTVEYIERRRNFNSYNKRKPSLGMHFQKPSMAQQQFAYECELNNIVDRNMQYKDPSFVTKLQLMHASNPKREPIFGDFSDVPTYQNAKNTLIAARDQFNTLPAKVRARFDNNPVKLLEFVNDPNSYDEGVKLGLFKEKQQEITQKNPENPQGSSQMATSGDVSEGSAQ